MIMKTRITAPNPQQMQSRKERANTLTGLRAIFPYRDQLRFFGGTRDREAITGGESDAGFGRFGVDEHTRIAVVLELQSGFGVSKREVCVVVVCFLDDLEPPGFSDAQAQTSFANGVRGAAHEKMRGFPNQAIQLVGSQRGKLARRRSPR
jgi:hypothetical protein